MEEKSSNKMLPKVSIMIPTYNQELFISDAINSSLEQDYENLEIVVSDDCSTDDTENVVRKFLSDNRLKYYKNPENLGRVGNYHKTLYDYASGDWAVNLDGDDYYIDSSFISNAMKLLLKNPTAVFYMSSHTAFESTKKVINYSSIDENAIILSGKDYFLNVSKIGGFNHYSLLYNRKIAKEIGFYTADSLTCDFHSGMRLALRGDVIFSPKKIAYWRVHEKNASTTEMESMLEKNIIAFKDIAIDSLKFISPEEKDDWERKAIGAAKNGYIMSIAATSSSLKDVPLLILHFKWNRSYIISFVKMLFHCLGISRKKEKRFNLLKQ